MSPRYNKHKRPVSHNLKDLSSRELGVKLDKGHQKADWGGEITPEMLEYAARDSQVLPPLVDALGTKIQDDNLEGVLDLERRLTPAIIWMASSGVPVDVEGWEAYREKTKTEVAKAIQNLNGIAPDRPEGVPWNWNSPQQILKAFELLGVALPDTKEKTLSKIDHPLARALLEYRNTKKRLDTCSQWLSQVHEGRVYASWKQLGAETGRMSCSGPNLQNLHKEDEMRRFVRAPEGKVLIRADYSQMELRILAQFSGDVAMIEAFEKGEDLHRATAAKMYGIPEDEVTSKQRSSAKAISFGIVYGMTPIGLAGRLGTDEATASELIEQYFLAYPKVKEYLDANASRAQTTGVLRTPIGRARRFGEASAMSRRERNEVGRQAKNFPIQGCCADGLKSSLVLLYERRDEVPGAVPVLAVHDEIVVECDEDKAEEAEAWLKSAMIEGMERALNDSDGESLNVEVEVEASIAKSWAG
ncbi:MAG: DNA polymerase [Actinomycetota bacterium]|nr:DNA polymerase [Actinomycetota bacterium]